MKSFREYLAESKKMYTFKVKVAGEMPEKFLESLKNVLSDRQASHIEKVNSTPIQSQPLDFPSLQNVEVSVFEVACEYPINTQEMLERVKQLDIPESHIIVRSGTDTGDMERSTFDLKAESGEALLNDSECKDAAKIKHKDYFGDDFNKGFLKDLQKVAKERTKEEGKGEYKLPKAKQDKAGVKSAMGS